jgi:HSP20 family protein
MTHQQNQFNQYPIMRIPQEFNRFIKKMFQEPIFQAPSDFAMNVREEAHQYIVEAELPGIKPEDIEIELHGNVLTIKGERREEEYREGVRSHLIESRYGAFYRSFTLPEHINAERITAETRNGILYVYLPKDPSQGPRKIEINKPTH